jgi:hypothetical protein
MAFKQVLRKIAVVQDLILAHRIAVLSVDLGIIVTLEEIVALEMEASATLMLLQVDLGAVIPVQLLPKQKQ